MQEKQKAEIDLYIINKVKAMRNHIGMSQAVLAIKIGVSDTFIGSVENPSSRAKYNISHLNKLAEVFNCSPKDFLPEFPM